MTQKIHWQGELLPQAIDALNAPGGLIVSPTKVGYIIITRDRQGLERKFDAKQRKRNKPGVVLCSGMAQLRALAQLTPEIETLYQRHYDEDILLGCILPWREDAKTRLLGKDGREELMMDKRGTSCFVIRFGTPGEQIAKHYWENGEQQLIFASSANPSGKGNRGMVEGIGERIAAHVDLIIEADDYVASIQPDKTIDTRYEQGVMVSMVDKDGTLIPAQNGARGISPAPVLIRKGLDVDKIMMHLADIFPSWDYRHGDYY